MSAPNFVDEFGLPRHVLSKSDDFYAALGRVAAVAAIVELRMSDLVELWGFTSEHRGKSPSQLARRFGQIAADRMGRNVEMPDDLVSTFAYAAATIELRNEVLHSLWPPSGNGWRNRRDGSIDTTVNTPDDLRGLIRRLVDASDRLSPYLRSPVEE